MPFSGVADREQLTILRTALEEHCKARGISDPAGKDHVAARVILLFGNGVTNLADLLAGLEDFSEPKRLTAVLTSQTIPRTRSSDWNSCEVADGMLPGLSRQTESDSNAR